MLRQASNRIKLLDQSAILLYILSFMTVVLVNNKDLLDSFDANVDIAVSL